MIQSAKDELQKAMYAVSEKLYQDAAAQGAAASATKVLVRIG